MSTENARRAYELAALAHGAATDRGDYLMANEAYDNLIAALMSLRQCQDLGRRALTDMLRHDDAHVRCFAATHLLPLDESASIRLLEELASEGPFVGVTASVVLREWKAGRLKVP